MFSLISSSEGDPFSQDKDNSPKNKEYRQVEPSYKNLDTMKQPAGPFSSCSDIGFFDTPNLKFRQTMEDGHCIIDKFRGKPNEGFFAIYDGHGGRRTVDYLQSFLHKRFHISLDESYKKEEEEKNNAPPEPEDPNAPKKPTITKSVREAFVKTYKTIDKELEDQKTAIDNGATAVTCYLKTEKQTTPTDIVIRKKLFTANCGDARVVLSRRFKAERLTYDHKASDKKEAKRIESLQGFIAYNRVNGVLSVTRAFGDHSMKKFVVVDPYFTEVTLNDKKDQFLILACDGIWDVLTDQEAVDLVKMDYMEFLNQNNVANTVGGTTPPKTPSKKKESIAQKMSQKLVQTALTKGSKDNISCMVVIL